MQRTVSESRAGRCTVDGFATVAAELEALHREKLLQAVKTPLTADLIPQAFRPHGEWVASRLNIFSAAYNTNLVKKDEAPKSYEDLKNPRWKGGSQSKPTTSTGSPPSSPRWDSEKGVKLFQDIVDINGMSVRKGHTLLSNLVVAGEVPLALTVYSYKPEQQKRAGAPIEPLYLRPLVALGYGPAVATARRIRTRRCCSTTSCSARARRSWPSATWRRPIRRCRRCRTACDLTMIDPADMLDNRAKWDELWNKTIAKPQ